MSLIAGVLWIVVAIMLFVKKDPNQPNKSQNQSSHQWMTGNLKGLIMIVKDDPYLLKYRVKIDVHRKYA